MSDTQPSTINYSLSAIQGGLPMATRTVAGKTVQVNEEGFMTNPAEWTKEIAQVLATEEGVGELTPAHWKVIDFCRADASSTGKAPTLRRITAAGSVSTKELFALFPKGPAKKVAKISGLGKPEGCV
jgi:dissimilatory sulfite reductase related protein